jgi:prephenate dehydratase
MSKPISSQNDDDGYYRLSHEVVALRKSSLYSPTSVATLAGSDPRTRHITCSWVVAEKSFSGVPIHGFPSFEEACESVLNGESDVLFVPAAYPAAYHFIQNVQLKVIDTFIMPIPALVHAGKTTKIPANPSTLYLHKSPERLADEFLQFDRKEFCDSNEVVCKKLLADPDIEAVCITNKVAAEFMGLFIYAELAVPEMPWLVFRKK